MLEVGYQHTECQESIQMKLKETDLGNRQFLSISAEISGHHC